VGVEEEEEEEEEAESVEESMRKFLMLF